MSRNGNASLQTRGAVGGETANAAQAGLTSTLGELASEVHETCQLSGHLTSFLGIGHPQDKAESVPQPQTGPADAVRNIIRLLRLANDSFRASVNHLSS